MTPFTMQCTYVDEDKWAWGGSTRLQMSRWCEILIFLHTKFWDSHTDSTLKLGKNAPKIGK